MVKEKLVSIPEGELRELRAAAFEDELTGLPNRRAFAAEIARAAADARRYSVLFIDLDRFKRINDDFGHVAGDELLQHAARRLRARLRSGDFLARIGGDEFAVLLRAGDARGVVERLRRPLRLPGLPTVGVSVGAGSALDHASRRMYDDKRSPRRRRAAS